MPGWSNSTNKFGPTDFVCGQSLGAGVNYTSINAAITDATAAGASCVYIRGGVNYTENLVLQPGIDLYGVTADGRAGVVTIVGDHTYDGGGTVAMTNIAFLASATDLFTVTTGTGNATIAFTNCSLDGAVSAVLNCTAGAGDQIATIVESCSLTAGTRVFNLSGAGNGFINTRGSTFDGSDIFVINAGFTVNVLNCTSTASTGVFADINDPSAILNVDGGTHTSNNESLLFSSAGQASITNTFFNSNAVSGNFADGAAGTLAYGGIVLGGSATGIGGGLTASKIDWKPYADAGAAPGTGVPRGTACFDANDFQVVDGFVNIVGSTTGPVTNMPTDSGTAFPLGGAIEILGGPGVTTSAVGNVITVNAVVWNNETVSTTVAVDTGTFFTGGAGQNFDLPALPLQGETCKFTNTTANSFTITADPAHTIRIGNQISVLGSTAQSLNAGDSVSLVYNDDDESWIAESVIGNWVVT